MKPKTADKPNTKQVIKFKASLLNYRGLVDRSVNITFATGEDGNMIAATIANLGNIVLDITVAPESDTTEFGGRE